MRSSPDNLLLSTPEVAALAQVKRSVVPTWRRRYADFPPPASVVNGRPLFHAGEVVAWLSRRGLGNAEATHFQAELSLHSLSAYAHQVGPRRLVELLGSLLCLRCLDGRPLAPADDSAASADPAAAWAALMVRADRMDPEDEFVLHELRTADSAAIGLARLADELVEAAYHGGGAYEWLLAARARLVLTDLMADMLTPEFTRFLARIADVRCRAERQGRVTVADPHARVGDLLAALVREAGDPADVQVLAAEPNIWLARLIRRRLLVAGVPELFLDVQAGVELEEGLADPDVIITQLPYRPAEERAALAALDAVERLSDFLRPGSTALVVGPAAALVDALAGTEEAKRRSALLRSGVVEAIISLPGGVTPYRPGYRCALWVLTRDPVPAARGYVLLADISAEVLSEHVCTQLTEDVLLWRAEGLRRPDGHDPRTGRIVPIAKLEEKFGGPLTPLGPPLVQLRSRLVEERPALINELEHRLERAQECAWQYVATHGPLSGRAIRRTGPYPARTTIGALIVDKRVSRLKGHRLRPQHLASTGRHRVFGPPEIRPGSADSARRIDRLTLADSYERIVLTEPGDVIYTSSPEWAVMVDRDGFSVVEFPARGLRVNPNSRRPLTSRVLAALLGAACDTGRSPSAVRAARRIEELAIPDLDPEEVERFDALLADIEQREQLLSAQAGTLAELRRLTVAGVADGTLTVYSSGAAVDTDMHVWTPE